MTDTPSPPNQRRRRIVVTIAVLVLVLSWWFWPRSDQRFVGTWQAETPIANEDQGDDAQKVFELRGNGLSKSFFAASDQSTVAINNPVEWQVRSDRFQLVEHDATLAAWLENFYYRVKNGDRRKVYFDAEIIVIDGVEMVLRDKLGTYRFKRAAR